MNKNYKIAPSYHDAEIISIDEEARKAHIKIKCPRCNGLGIIVSRVENGQPIPIPVDGGVCYKCNGAKVVSKWVKAYTEKEYERYMKAQERVREKRQEKAEAKLQALKDNSEENKKAVLAKWGFDPADPAVYLVAGGNTFEIKDELKERGGRFNPALNWYFTKEVEVPEGFELVKVSFDEVYDWYPMVKRIDIKQNAKEVADAARATVLTDSKSDFVGTVKERMRDLKVVLTGRREFDKGYYGTTTMLTFTLDDNVLVWFASSYIPEEKTIVGHDYLLTGTVKEHKIYDGVKQTYLNRCILKEVC